MRDKLQKRDRTTLSGTLLDEEDREILSALSEDSRSSINKLSRLVGLSTSSTAERVRRLEARGVIQGFCVKIDPRALGYLLQAIVRIKPLPGKLHLIEETIKLTPEFVECNKIIGDQCLICRLFLKTIEQLDEILSKISELSETNVSIVKSTFVERRLPPIT